MADIGGAATRLRRTFRYPTDHDDPNNSEPEALDEEGTTASPSIYLQSVYSSDHNDG